jgi:hypothetical protein
VTLKPNYDDSTQNDSSIAASIGASITVPPFDPMDYSQTKTRDQVIADVMAQARAFYADFNVDLVTTRPTAGDYVMTAVGGDPSLINMPCDQNGCVAGLAPLDCQPGNPIQYNTGGDVEVVYAFSATAKYFGGSYSSLVLDLATTVAQETAHAYGLGHTNNMQDVMYPYETGQTVGFLSGGYADTFNCANGQGSQDSHGLLLQILGASMGPGDTTPPTISVTSPSQGATVPRSFNVTVSANDNVGVARVDFSAQGPGTTQTASASAAPFTGSLAVDADGVWAVTATAFDAAGNMASATVSVTVKSGALLPFGSACTMGPQCSSGLCEHSICNQSCSTVPCPTGYTCGLDHACTPMQMIMPGDVGAPCTQNGDCHSNQCATLGVKKFCTQACKIGDPMGCPNGTVCTSFGSDGLLCAPPTGGGGGGCTVGRAPERGAADLGLLLLALLALPLARRRSARSARSR